MSLPVYFGVDYYPEHWDPDMMDSDVRRIAELGATMVRIGEFAWHLMEPQPGEFDFSFFDAVVARCAEHGIAVMFGTPTATFPAWLAVTEPSIVSVGADGRARVFGGRRQYCVNSVRYRQHADAIVSRLVAHYREHPTVVAWQVDNEFGHEGSDDCYCPTCGESFGEFLAARYGTIDALNAAWGTIFWGQTYDSFAQIPMPLATITTHNPGLKLDWARFRSRSLNDFAHSQIRLVKELAGTHQIVTTNVAGGFFGKLFDHAEQVRDLDVVSYDNYPVWGGLAEPMSAAAIAMTLDFARGLQGRNFWVVEQLIGAQGHDVIGYLPRPGQAKMWAYQAFAHGCETMLWFRWRGMNRGAEQFCFGIIDADDEPGRKYQEVAQTIADVSKNIDVLRVPITAEVAVLYDFENVWAWRGQIQSAAFDFTTELLRLYAPFHRKNLPIDVIPVDRDFSGYRVVVAPVLQLLSTDTAARLEAFAQSGGTVVFSFRTGLKNPDNTVPLRQTLPGVVRRMCGIKVREVESLQAWQEVPVVGCAPNFEGDFAAGVWRDLIELEGAQMLARYDDDFFRDRAAVTVNQCVDGWVYYVGCGLGEDFLQRLVDGIAADCALPVIDTEPDVEVCRRRGPDADFEFVLNHSGVARNYRGRALDPYSAGIHLVSDDVHA